MPKGVGHSQAAQINRKDNGASYCDAERRWARERIRADGGSGVVRATVMPKGVGHLAAPCMNRVISGASYCDAERRWAQAARQISAPLSPCELL